MTTENSVKQITAATIQAVAKFIEKAASAENAIVNALDSLIGDGYTRPSDLVSPKVDKHGKYTDKNKSTSTVEEYQAVQQCVIAGFSTTVQKMLATPSDQLVRSEDRKDYTTSKLEMTTANKFYHQQQIGTRIGDLRRQFEKRLKIEARAEQAESKGDKTSRVRTTDQFCLDSLLAMRKRCQATEEANFNIAEMVQAIDTALELLTGIVRK